MTKQVKAIEGKAGQIAHSGMKPLKNRFECTTSKQEVKKTSRQSK
ncbi:hypothetical protein [Paenibacillus profundus]|nr:hypothetical protein [Paenibacillus profundus]